jgi:hypothetical protein
VRRQLPTQTHHPASPIVLLPFASCAGSHRLPVTPAVFFTTHSTRQLCKVFISTATVYGIGQHDLRHSQTHLELARPTAVDQLHVCVFEPASPSPEIGATSVVCDFHSTNNIYNDILCIQQEGVHVYVLSFMNFRL